MPDAPSNSGRQDRQRIDVHQEHECRYWSDRLGVSPERLRQAVKEAGPMVEAVKQQLGK